MIDVLGRKYTNRVEIISDYDSARSSFTKFPSFYSSHSAIFAQSYPHYLTFVWKLRTLDHLFWSLGKTEARCCCVTAGYKVRRPFPQNYGLVFAKFLFV